MTRKSTKRKRARKAASTGAGRPPESPRAFDQVKLEPDESAGIKKADLQRLPAAAFPRTIAFAGWTAAMLAVALFYLTLKMYAMNGYAGDEYIYLYQAKLVSQGAVPYADFSMAHPPVQTLFTAIVFKLFGYHFLLGRLLPVLWCLLGAVLLGVVVFRELGALASIASTALYLLSYEPLRASSHYTGVNMTVALVLAGVSAFRFGAVRSAAALSMAAVFTRFYAIPGVVVLAAFALFVLPSEGVRFVKWCAAFGAAFFFSIGFWTGFADFLDNTFFYHAQKTSMADETLASMRDGVLFHNAAIILLFVLAQLALLVSVDSAYQKKEKSRRAIQRMREVLTQPGTGLLLLCSTTAVFFLLILLNMDRVWMYYFIPAFPFAAVPAGWLVSSWIDAALRLIRARANLARANLTRADLAGGAALVALAVVGLYFSPALESRLGYYQRAMGKAPRDRVYRYDWKPGLLPGAVNRWVKSTLWSDERVIGERYHAINFLLWHESRTLDPLEEMLETIRSNCSRGGEIFGDSGTVPLLALLSERRIAANEVDTNIQRYRSGNADPEALIKKIDNPKTELIILRQRYGVAGLKEIQQLVREKYSLLKSFRVSEDRAIYHIYKREEREKEKIGA
ncbi:MAG: hypothetical protein JXA30_12165 [Deltaproteobacteria bacterium]|nr:hypothetical protein [Deltaproteobacteria bacterium]